jgi:predicted RNA binding protein YcfA (HicA-like mRNA interferase family)
MSRFAAAKARRVLAALLRVGWEIKRQSGSHRTLSRPGWLDVTFAFHDDEEIGCFQGPVLNSVEDVGFSGLVLTIWGLWRS